MYIRNPKRINKITNKIYGCSILTCEFIILQGLNLQNNHRQNKTQKEHRNNNKSLPFKAVCHFEKKKKKERYGKTLSPG